MRVLIIGSGGREHAFAHAICQSDRLSALFVAPGNAGILQLADSAPVDVADHGAVAQFCADERIDLVVVGPDAALVDGLAEDASSLVVPLLSS